MTDEVKKIVEFHAKAFNTILDAMAAPRVRCSSCQAYTHDLTDGLCIACRSVESDKG